MLRQTFFWVLLSFLMACALFGFWIDHLSVLTQGHMFWGIHLVAWLSIAIISFFLFSKLEHRWSKTLYILGLFVAWRVSYFPFMVFSGHGASIVEWLLAYIPAEFNIPIIVYPVYFSLIAILNGISAVVVWYLVKPAHPLAYALALPLATVATLISFTAFSDTTQLFPDRLWEEKPSYPEVSLPSHNPYLSRLKESGYTFPQRVLFFAAGNTYDTIPESPWARVVKGVLEAQTDANPHASSEDRVFEHYLGYLVAHQFLGCHYEDSRERCQLDMLPVRNGN